MIEKKKSTRPRSLRILKAVELGSTKAKGRSKFSILENRGGKKKKTVAREW